MTVACFHPFPKIKHFIHSPCLEIDFEYYWETEFANWRPRYSKPNAYILIPIYYARVIDIMIVESFFFHSANDFRYHPIFHNLEYNTINEYSSQKFPPFPITLLKYTYIHVVCNKRHLFFLLSQLLLVVSCTECHAHSSHTKCFRGP